MTSWRRDPADGHATIEAAEASARKYLVVDEQNARQNIDLGSGPHSSSSTSSLGSEPRSPIGRDINYSLADDHSEQHRLDLQHQIYLTTLDGKLNLAPISPGIKSALDIGTGTGIWVVDFARRYPSAGVLGFDKSICKPAYVPANAKFQLQDPEQQWPFERKFDYIHCRSRAFSFDSPAVIIQKAYEALTPGCYLEMQDYMIPMRSVDNTYINSATEKWQVLTMQGAANLGRDLTQAKNYRRYMEQAGFVDIVEKHYQWPLGPWAKDRRLKAIGVLFREDMERVADNWSAKLLIEGMGMNDNDVSWLLGNVKREWKLGKLHAYVPIVVVYGKKPI